MDVARSDVRHATGPHLRNSGPHLRNSRDARTHAARPPLLCQRQRPAWQRIACAGEWGGVRHTLLPGGGGGGGGGGGSWELAALPPAQCGGSRQHTPPSSPLRSRASSRPSDKNDRNEKLRAWDTPTVGPVEGTSPVAVSREQEADSTSSSSFSRSLLLLVGLFCRSILPLHWVSFF